MAASRSSSSSSSVSSAAIARTLYRTLLRLSRQVEEAAQLCWPAVESRERFDACAAAAFNRFNELDQAAGSQAAQARHYVVASHASTSTFNAAVRAGFRTCNDVDFGFASIREAKHHLQSLKVSKQWTELMKRGGDVPMRIGMESSDQGWRVLEDGVILVGRLANPGAEDTSASVRQQLDSIAAHVNRLLASQQELAAAEEFQSALMLQGRQRTTHSRFETAGRRYIRSSGVHEKLDLLNYVLFQELGFQDSSKDGQHEPITLQGVFREKLGAPLGIGIVYTLIGARLGLNIQPLNLPGYFLSRIQPSSDSNMKAALYVDAYNRGTLMTKPECTRLLCQAGFDSVRHEELLKPASPRDVWIRMMRMLSIANAQLGKREQAFYWASKIAEVPSALSRPKFSTSDNTSAESVTTSASHGL
eukprot:jgi/Chlat1/9031/Chrsp94S08299